MRRSIKKHCINKPEDATVGLCAHLHKVALVGLPALHAEHRGAPVVDGRTPGVVQWTRQELPVFTADARFCPRPVSVRTPSRTRTTSGRCTARAPRKVQDAAESTAVAPPEAHVCPSRGSLHGV